MMNQKREINPFLEFQIRNIHNDIASKFFGGIFSDLATDEQKVVTAYVQNLLLYNHFITCKKAPFCEERCFKSQLLQ